MPNHNYSLPFVSVVIPVYNSEKQITKTFDALENQSYPRERFEIIVIDNGSKDCSLKILEKKNLLLLYNKRAKNPYISRNIGVAQAGGEVIAFLDITCTPHKKWMEEGVELLKSGADLVGGKIEYKFSDSPTFGEWYDSITFVNVEAYIKKFRSAVGGNLFIKREVWQEMGAFPEDMRSGVDGYWTRLASQKGFNLQYGKDAIVYYPARSLKGVLKKSYRVGKGHVKAWVKEKKAMKFILTESLKTFSPPSLNEVESKVNNRGFSEMEDYIYHLWLISWLNKVAMGMGRMVSIMNRAGK